MQLPTLPPALDGKGRIAIAVAGLAATLAVLALAWGGTGPRMALLYGGLDNAAAGEVLTALEARGIPHEVSAGAIHVPEAERDRLRLQLAAEGLPDAGIAGYEILEGLSGLATTDRMFDAAYWRAREGELARTIAAAMPGLAVRVHLSAAPARGLAPRQDPSASVSLTGGGLPSPPRLDAIRHLVAASVPGLRPEAVALIGPDGRLAGDATDRAGYEQGEAIAARARRILEARVGPGRAVVEVGLDVVAESETLRERTIDPDSRTVISVESEAEESEGPAGGGTVTVASNLPDGQDAGGGGGVRADSRTLERTNYEVSETERTVERGPGGVRRLTVAVLIDLDRDEAGQPVPRPETELEALRLLVASAVGLDEARGDSLTLHAMAFGDPANDGTTAEAVAPSSPWPLETLVRAGAVLLSIVLTGLFVLRPILAGRPNGPPALPPAEVTPPLVPVADAAPASGQTPALAPGTAPPSLPAPVTEAPPTPLSPDEELTRRIAERPRESVALLGRWLEEEPA
ncbi:MAG: flagellar basal-body MS-ring/collar protein FliF [Hasllibacter sp.]